MKNSNTLIVMAQVAQNGNNPFMTFCEFIKYCIYVSPLESMTISEVKTVVGKEFGLYLPHNILIKCLSHIETEGIISCKDHLITRIGRFDTNAFDNERTLYRKKESELIKSLMQFVAEYHRDWTYDYARELLIKVLDRNGLAYDIFLHDNIQKGVSMQIERDIESIIDMFPDDESSDSDADRDQMLFSDEYFVGKYIDKLFSEQSFYIDYLKAICEGLMLCVGAYQIPDIDSDASVLSIKGTSFFFDTKLLLRFLGCAGEAAVESVKELVSLIQSSGGNIYYYPQTLTEMEYAFDKAIRSLSNGSVPYDDEMRIYSTRIKHNIAILTAKKASLKEELSHSQIYYRQHDTFSEADRIRFGFDQNDLRLFMQEQLSWDYQVIENDAQAIWETHMRRQGNYDEYCGTSSKLPVFVTTNSRLIGVALKYREERTSFSSVSKWRINRLPVITDIRLTCRLWSPSSQGDRMSLLYLTANTVAAKRPTPCYINKVKALVDELREEVPQYSGICLSSYFDDNVTDAIFEDTKGLEEKMNIATFASTINELSEWKAREQEEVTAHVISERDEISLKFDAQTQCVIDGAVNANKNKLGIMESLLWLCLHWSAFVSFFFAGIFALVSYLSGDWRFLLIICVPSLIYVVEKLLSSSYVQRLLLKALLPKAEIVMENKVVKNLREVEKPYKKEIISQIKEQSDLWQKITKIVGEKK